jgi:hypothetical protein
MAPLALLTFAVATSKPGQNQRRYYEVQGVASCNRIKPRCARARLRRWRLRPQLMRYRLCPRVR